MKSRVLLGSVLPALALLAGFQGRVFGQDMLDIQGASPVLSITGGTPTGGPASVTDVSTRLRYRQSTFTTKITVSTNCPGQHFSLSVTASGVSVGIPAPEVALYDGMPDTDLITNIPPGPRRRNQATLRYTASATFEQGNSTELGDDVHLVTYTIVQQ